MKWYPCDLFIDHRGFHFKPFLFQLATNSQCILLYTLLQVTLICGPFCISPANRFKRLVTKCYPPKSLSQN